MLEATKVYVRSEFSLHNSECLDTFRIFFKFFSVYYIVNTNRQIGNQPLPINPSLLWSAAKKKTQYVLSQNASELAGAPALRRSWMRLWRQCDESQDKKRVPVEPNHANTIKIIIVYLVVALSFRFSFEEFVSMSFVFIVCFSPVQLTTSRIGNN